MQALTQFLSVPHHQLLLGLGLLLLLQLVAWVHAVRRADARSAGLAVALVEAQQQALGPLVERIQQ
ncbi:MAG: hypothetical protein V2J24_08320, partial [Pseudomonadales bacterium]|nr:hypothetical protein [Pseudomonadales bacterium]